MHKIKIYCTYILLFYAFQVSAKIKKQKKQVAITNSGIRQKLNATIAYFQHIGENKLEMDVQLLLPYLEKKFTFHVFEKQYHNENDKLPLLYRNFWIYEPNDYWDSASSHLQDSIKGILQNTYKNASIDVLTTYACLCDKITLPPDYFDLLHSKIGMDGYELTHAALQYKNLEIKKCISDQTYVMKQTEISKKMTENILFANPSFNSVYDLKIEAAVFLYYLKSPLLKEKKIWSVFSSLFQFQDKSGGWKRGPDNVVSQHTSLLALWWLLEMKHME